MLSENGDGLLRPALQKKRELEFGSRSVDELYLQRLMGAVSSE